MTPTEHELTAATQALGRTLYDAAHDHARTLNPDVPTWDEITPTQRHPYLEHALTIVTPILDALPDRLATLRRDSRFIYTADTTLTDLVNTALDHYPPTP